MERKRGGGRSSKKTTPTSSPKKAAATASSPPKSSLASVSLDRRRRFVHEVLVATFGRSTSAAATNVDLPSGGSTSADTDVEGRSTSADTNVDLSSREVAENFFTALAIHRLASSSSSSSSVTAVEDPGPPSRKEREQAIQRLGTFLSDPSFGVSSPEEVDTLARSIEEKAFAATAAGGGPSTTITSAEEQLSLYRQKIYDHAIQDVKDRHHQSSGIRQRLFGESRPEK